MCNEAEFDDGLTVWRLHQGVECFWLAIIINTHGLTGSDDCTSTKPSSFSHVIPPDFDSAASLDETCSLLYSSTVHAIQRSVLPTEKKQVRKVLWTRKAPACLLTLLYAYGKPRLCIKIHQRRALCCSRPLQWTLRYTHCAMSARMRMQSFIVLCCVLRKPWGFFRELTTTTRTTRVAFWDPPSGSKTFSTAANGAWEMKAFKMTRWLFAAMKGEGRRKLPYWNPGRLEWIWPQMVLMRNI